LLNYTEVLSLKKALGLLGLVIIACTLLSPALEASWYRSLIVIFLPGGRLEPLIESLNKTGFLKVQWARLADDLGAPLDFYIAWLLAGEPPASKNVSLYDAHVVGERAYRLWDHVVLVDIPPIDPTIYKSAVNLLYNWSINQIQPAIFEVPVNGTVYWGDLDTLLNITVEGYTFRLRLERYATGITIANVTPGLELGPILINATELGERSGLYWLTFYLVNLTESKAIIFFPGAMRTRGFYSEVFSEPMEVLVHWSMIYRNRHMLEALGREAIVWWFNKTVLTTSSIVNKTLAESNRTLYIVYAPHADIAQRLLSEELYNEIAQAIYDKLVRDIVLSANRYKPDFLAIFILSSPNGTYAVFASRLLPETKELEGYWTMSGLVSTIMTYSAGSPLKHQVALEDSNKLVEVQNENSQLRVNLTFCNLTLQDTSRRLSSCESDRSLLQAKVAEIDRLKSEAEELKRAALAYISTGIATSVAIAILMGFLGLRVTAKRRTR
jgi:hypothetical protein